MRTVVKLAMSYRNRHKSERNESMNKKTIAVIFGGESPEYSVSLQSATSIIRALDRNKYDVIPVGISQKGEWFQYIGDIELIEQDKWLDKELCNPIILSPDKSIHGLIGETNIIAVDVVFPVLHGKNGEDGTVQGLLELSGIPYTGCKVLASALCMDKVRAHELVNAKGIRSAKNIVITNLKNFDEVKKEVENIGYPVFVKPVCAGSSYGISKIYKSDNLRSAIERAFRYDDEVVIEEMIEGFEVGCSIIGNEDLTIGAVDEIELTADFFDYEEKYVNNTSKTYVPARITSEEADKIRKAAQLIYRTLGCCGYARIDMFYTPKKEIVFNEVNTIPGFTSHSRFPNMMKAVGISFEETVEKIVDLALDK